MKEEMSLACDQQLGSVMPISFEFKVEVEDACLGNSSNLCEQLCIHSCS